MITKEEFKKYLEVANEGKYNVITDYKEASEEAGLSKETWFKIIEDFDKLCESFKDVYENN